MRKFNYKLKEVLAEVRRLKAKRVLLQFPEGIKQEASDVVKKLEKHVECVVSGETCWGGCDIDINEAKAVKADLIVHFGHAPFIKYPFPIFYVHVEDDKSLVPLAKKVIKQVDGKRVALLSSIQHIHKLGEVKKFFEKEGLSVTIPGKKGYSALAGHVVGCEYGGLKVIRDKIDSVVVIGNQFHGLGAALAVVDKQVLLMDTYNNAVRSMGEEKKRFMQQRAASIARVKDAKKIGVIVGLKKGQQFGAASIVKKNLEKVGKQVIVITMREMTPDKLFNFYDVEAFVELACPRIATDDYGKYKKPMITFREAQVVAGKITWDDILKQGFI
jgi:2-(3-amino-3-carboxypropyl)histidine synthase